MSEAPHTRDAVPGQRRLVRLVLLSFVLGFVAARTLVLLIMARVVPDLYVHVGGTHVHHLNFGIALLSFVGGALLFTHPQGRALRALAVAYGLGLALTFDEFGMWLHLGGGYWQRASYDALIVITLALALLAYLPPPRRWTARAVATAIMLLLALSLFVWRSYAAIGAFESKAAPRLHRLEAHGPA